MEPKLDTLQEAIVYFSNPTNCREYVAARRWPNGVTCPRCGSEKVKFLEKYNRWQCGSRHKNRQFTAKTGTIFEDSPLGLDKWLAAMWQVVNCKNGVSSYEVHRAIGVTQKTAWFMDHRIRLALQTGSLDKFGGEGGEVEVDETFVGGKMRNMHKSRRQQLDRLRSETVDANGMKHLGKTAIMGILDRDLRKIRAKVVPNVKRETLQYEILNQVEFGARLYSDDAVAYNELASLYAHDVVNHAQEYVKGRVHTNGLENFWSLLKRGLNGTYVAVEPFHLFRYVDEQVFRYNNRKDMNDGQRFDLAVRQIVGKRLTWSDLTGKQPEPSTVPF
jgi:transposase-like protein